MRKHRLIAVGATLLAATLSMSACGSRAEEGGTTGETSNKVAKIGVIAPLSGDLSALGLGIQNSVDLAIKQANESNAIPGWTLELAAEDDEAKPDVGKNAATKLAGDDEVVGVVGTLNSSVAQSVQPVLAAANIAHGLAGQHQPDPDPGSGPGQPRSGPYPNYFRTCTTDAVQGPFAANYLHRRGHEERRHHPRQEGVRPGPGRRLHHRVQVRRRQRSWRPRRSTPMTRTSPPSSTR